MPAIRTGTIWPLLRDVKNDLESFFMPVTRILATQALSFRQIDPPGLL
jgi:hypothetical protein